MESSGAAPLVRADQGASGRTVLDLLVEAADRLAIRRYAGEQMVVEIDGVSASERHGLIFRVNGEWPSVGPSRFTTREGDRVEWFLCATNVSGR